MTQNLPIEMDVAGILKLQLELSRVLADVVDPSVGLDVALAKVIGLPGLDGAWTWFRGYETGDFHLHNSAGINEDLALQLDVLPMATPAGQRLIARQETVGSWAAIWPDQLAEISTLGWSDAALLPIVCQGEVVGALGGTSRQPGGIDEKCLLVLRTLANATGSLVATIRNDARHRTVAENLSHMLDSFVDRMYIVDAGGTVLYHNLASAAGRPDGLPLVGQDISVILPDYAAVRRTIGELDQAFLRAMPLQANLADGRGGLRPVEVRVEAGSWDGAAADIVVCRDIAGQLGREQAHQRLTAAAADALESIVVTDAAGVVKYVNPAFTAMTGYQSSEVIGQTPAILKSGRHDSRFYADIWQHLTAGRVWSGRLINRAKNGDLFTEEATISPVIGPDGVITHYVGVKRDVTRDVATEERLREAQKMEAIGTLAGGLAHDFNNILYALLGYVELALDDVPPDHRARVPLEEIARAGERAAHLVARMLTFGRRGDGTRGPVDVTTTIADGLELVRATLPPGVRLHSEFPDQPCSITADAGQIHQVLLNLAANAAAAMPDGGDLTVRVDRGETGPPPAGAATGARSGDWARIRVSDTGCGIDSSVIDRIFEPYFSTSRSHVGSGLGLATVHGVISGHGGRITVASEPGVGSEFTILLPVRAAAAEVGDVAAATKAEVPSRGRPVVMVIDDEHMVLDLLGKALVKFGYEVRPYDDGVEALESFRNRPWAFDVVITDQTMPNITGFELASEMLAIRPDLPLVLTTGYSDKQIRQDAGDAGIRYFMSKPIKLRELAEALSELAGSAAVS